MTLEINFLLENINMKGNKGQKIPYGAIKKGQSRETDNTGHTGRRKTKTQRNMCRTPPHPNKYKQGK